MPSGPGGSCPWRRVEKGELSTWSPACALAFELKSDRRLSSWKIQVQYHVRAVRASYKGVAQDPARRRSPGHHLPGRRIVSAKKSASTIPPFSARIARPSPPDTAANSKMKGKDYNGESRSDRRPDLRVLFGAPASTPVKSPSSFGSQILSESCSAKANTNARTDPAVPGEKGRVRRQRLPPPRNLVTSQSPGRERRRARTERRLGLDWTRGPGAVPDGWGTPGDAEERNASGRPRCRNGGAEGGLSPGRWEPAPAGRRKLMPRGGG